MSQTSYPIEYSTAPGAPAADVDHDMWRDLFTGSGEGVWNSQGTAGTDGRLTVPASGNTVTVGSCLVRHRGFELKVTDHALTLAEAIGSAVVYSIGSEYDSANQSVVGGCLTLKSVVRSTVSAGIASGDWHELFQVTRPPGALSLATVVDRRRPVGPSLLLPDDFPLTGVPFPVGSHAVRNGELLVRVPSPAVGPTGAAWQSLSNPPWQALGAVGGIGNVTGRSSGWRINAGALELKGVRYKSSGVTTFAVDVPTLIGTVPALPAGYTTREWGTHFVDVNVKVEVNLSGQITVTPHGPGVSSVRIDGARFPLT